MSKRPKHPKIINGILFDPNRIKTIQFGSDCTITNQSIANITNKEFPQLKEFVINNCPQITDDGIIAIVQNIEVCTPSRAKFPTQNLEIFLKNKKK